MTNPTNKYSRREFIGDGAGRFEPKSAFPYVMKAIRPKDGLCIGVDNPQQVAENAEFMRKLT